PRHSPSYFSRRRPHPILTLFTYTTLFRSYQSAIKAGYSESYAKSSSYKLLDIVGISQEIERVREEELDKVQKRFAIGATKAIKRSEEHTSELQSRFDLVCRLLLEKKKTTH